MGQIKAATEKEARKISRAVFSEFPGPATEYGQKLPERAQSGLKGGQRFCGAAWDQQNFKSDPMTACHQLLRAQQ